MTIRKRAAWIGGLLALAGLWIVAGGPLPAAMQASAQAPWPLRQPAEPLALGPVTDAMLREPAPGDWLMYRRTYDGWGYSPLDQIDRSNVGELRLALGLVDGERPQPADAARA